jgi:hypothetical protein
MAKTGSSAWPPALSLAGAVGSAARAVCDGPAAACRMSDDRRMAETIAFSDFPQGRHPGGH